MRLIDKDGCEWELSRVMENGGTAYFEPSDETVLAVAKLIDAAIERRPWPTDLARAILLALGSPE